MKNKIKELREKLGYSISDLSQKTAITRNKLKLIECKLIKPRSKEMLAISNALGHRVEEVFYE